MINKYISELISIYLAVEESGRYPGVCLVQDSYLYYIYIYKLFKPAAIGTERKKP